MRLGGEQSLSNSRRLIESGMAEEEWRMVMVLKEVA
jgi:hypothetical protein